MSYDYHPYVDYFLITARVSHQFSYFLKFINSLEINETKKKMQLVTLTKNIHKYTCEKSTTLNNHSYTVQD